LEIDYYEKDWFNFKVYVETKIKNRCDLTSKNWMRLREYHLDDFLKKHNSPYSFLFKVKYFHPREYSGIHCMPIFYGKYKDLRHKKFEGDKDGLS